MSSNTISAKGASIALFSIREYYIPALFFQTVIT